jgi:hypothetical protein
MRFNTGGAISNRFRNLASQKTLKRVSTADHNIEIFNPVSI